MRPLLAGLQDVGREELCHGSLQAVEGSPLAASRVSPLLTRETALLQLGGAMDLSRVIWERRGGNLLDGWWVVESSAPATAFNRSCMRWDMRVMIIYIALLFFHNCASSTLEFATEPRMACVIDDWVGLPAESLGNKHLCSS